MCIQENQRIRFVRKEKFQGRWFCVIKQIVEEIKIPVKFSENVLFYFRRIG